MIEIPGYKITKTIGHGGMATVYLAIQESIGRKVAIKVMSPSLAADPSFSDRFVKEARMANLIHPHIVTVYDAGAVDGTNYIIMEYAGGGNLDTLIKQGISVSRTIEVIKQVASALNYSSQEGYIHRDVKPENIIFRDNGSAVLMDFGIAKAISSATQLTMVGSTIGSPNYMSPEQARGLELDGRTDLYSLGVVFYECLTGTKPYDSADTYVIGLKHINDPIPRLPGKLSQFQPIIDRLLAKTPEGRFENGNALIEALDKFQISGDGANLSVQQTQSIDNDETRVKSAHDAVTVNVNTLVDDGTRVQPEPKSFTQDLNDETVVIPSEQQTLTTQKKSNKSLLIVSALVTLTISAGLFWYITKKDVVPDEPISPIEPITQVPPTVTAPIVVKPEEPVTEPEPSVVQQPEVNNEKLIEQLLSKAQSAIARKRYSSPKNDNALKYFKEVLTLDSNNAKAKSGLNTLADRYLSMANGRFKEKAFNSALKSINKGLTIIPDHQGLLTLRDKINQLQKPKIAKKTPLIKPEVHKTIFLKDLSIGEVLGKHRSPSLDASKFYAKNGLTENLYNRILTQCNSSERFINHPECVTSYNKFLKHWPLPRHEVSSSSKQSADSQLTRASFKQSVFSQTYKNKLQTLEDIINRPGDLTKKKLLALFNYQNYQPVAGLLGLKTQKINLKDADRYLKSRQIKNKTINTVNDLTSFVHSFAGKSRVFVAPISSHNSLEVTPFSAEIYQTIKNLYNTSKVSAKKFLYGEYRLLASGNTIIEFSLFDTNNELVSKDSVLLDKSLFSSKRKTNWLFNEEIIPKQRLKSSYGFPASIAMGKKTQNPLLLVGEKTQLRVKLAKPGFYFIAVHVVHEKEQYSYLLPLRQAEVPFVQVATRSQTHRFETLGEFDISPPLGVEVLQLIASSINLEKYLPEYHWDENRQKFIIKGSEGSIQKGLQEVRNYMNTVPNISSDKNVRWQERLMVTSILSN